MLLNDGENPKNVPQLELEARHKLHERYILCAIYSYCVEDVPGGVVQTMWLQELVVFNMSTDVDEYDCTRWLNGRRNR